MKKRILSIVFLFCFVYSYSQIPEPDVFWAAQADGEGENWSYDISFDEEGNSYITGFFKDTVSFGDFVLTATPSEYTSEKDGFIAKLDSEGNFIWAKQFGGDILDEGQNILVDESGNVYLTGRAGNTTFGDLDYPDSAYYFIAKLNSDGDFLWIKPVGINDGFTQAASLYRDLALDSSGNIYLSGNFKGELVLGDTTLEGEGEFTSFITKLNSAGDFIWSYKVGGDGFNSIRTTAADQMGDIYIAGTFEENIQLGNTQFTNSNEWMQIYLAKMDSNENFVWATKIEASGGSEVMRFTGDINGNQYLHGRFSGTLNLGDFVLTADNISADFILKIDSNGEFIWVKKLEKGSISDINLNPEGDILISGFYGFNGANLDGIEFPDFEGSQIPFIIKIRQNGEIPWMKFPKPREPEMPDYYIPFANAFGVTADSVGNIYVSGAFVNHLNFDNHIIETSPGSRQTFVLKLMDIDYEDMGVPEPIFTKESEITIYPNPVSHTLFIEGKNKISNVRIFDLTGRILINQNPNNQKVQLHTGNLNKGVYIVEVIDGNGKKTVKKVVKN